MNLPLIPFMENNFGFKLRESCRQIKDRKWYSINSIQCHLRSSIFDALTRLSSKLFSINGIRSISGLVFVFFFKILPVRILVFLSLVAIPFGVNAIEKQPWFGDVYQFHFLGSYAYSRFSSFQNARPPLNHPFQSNVGYLGLDFSPSPVWSVDGDIQFADTTAMSFNFRSIAIQGRYLWLDDIIGDPISLVTGANIRATSSRSLKDISCPSHGNVDFEVNFALGKEFEASNRWLFRTWFYGAVGHANRGSPWVRGILSIETNICDLHKWALYAEGINGYGRHIHVDVDHFYGYAKVREKAIDLGLRYGYRIDVWGTIRFEYVRRVLAKSAPQRVNTFILSYLLPFSF